MMERRFSKQSAAWGGFLILAGVMALVEMYWTVSPWAWVGVLGIAGVATLALYLTDRSDVGLLIPAYVAIAVALLIGLIELRILQDDVVAVFVLAVIALPFLAVYLHNRAQWWALIPAYVLLAVAVMIGLTESNILPDGLTATFVLTCIALPFLFVYWRNREHWWALIPAYVMIVIGIMVMLIEFDVLDDLWVPAYVMVVIALPFYYVYFRNRQNWWALIPAGILTVIGLSFAIAESAVEIVMPIALILVGGWLLLRQLGRGGSPAAEEVPQVEAQPPAE